MYTELKLISRETKQTKKMTPEQLRKFYEDNGVTVYSSKELEERKKNDWKEASRILETINSFRH